MTLNSHGWSHVTNVKYHIEAYYATVLITQKYIIIVLVPGHLGVSKAQGPVYVSYNLFDNLQHLSTKWTVYYYPILLLCQNVAQTTLIV